MFSRPPQSQSNTNLQNKLSSRIPNTKISSQSKLPVPKKQPTANAAQPPNFDRLHKEWEKSLQQRREEAKKKVTVPKEFSFATNRLRTSRRPDENSAPECNKQTSKAHELSLGVKQVKPSRSVTFESCPDSLQGILGARGIRETTQSKSQQPIGRKSILISNRPPIEDVRRKSLGPALRNIDVENNATDVHEERRKSIYDRSNAAANSVPLSKLDRRISTHFSKQAQKKEETCSADPSHPVTPGKVSTGYRAGLALLELQKTPGKAHLFHDNIKSVAKKDDDEWMRNLASSLLKRTSSTEEEQEKEELTQERKLPLPIHLKVSPSISLDNLPTPPPPIVTNERKVGPVSDLKLTTAQKLATNTKFEPKTVDEDDVTFKFDGSRVAYVPVDRKDVHQKTLTELKRSPAELFQQDGNGETTSIFSAPVIDSDDDEDSAGLKQEDDTCSIFFNSSILGLQTNLPQSISLQTPFKLKLTDEEDDIDSPSAQDIEEIKKQLEDLTNWEQSLMLQLN